MELHQRMNRAVDYIENNLDSRIDYDMAAREALCSSYHFQRMFSFITGIPLSEYVRRRRMTLAAFELQNTGVKVIDLAFKYGYDSHEAFTRAFQSVHGVTPTAARGAGGVVLRSYSRLTFQITVKGDREMKYRVEKKDAFQVYGIEEIFDVKEGENLKEIPEFWGRVMRNGEFDRLVKSTRLDGKRPADNMCPVNAICGTQEMNGTKFPYMICAFKTDKSDTSGYKVVDVPEATWAIFENEGHKIEEVSGEMQKLIQRVYSDWLPTASYDIIPGYEMEVYFGDENSVCHEETWVRVKETGAGK